MVTVTVQADWKEIASYLRFFLLFLKWQNTFNTFHIAILDKLLGDTCLDQRALLSQQGLFQYATLD